MPTGGAIIGTGFKPGVPKLIERRVGRFGRKRSFRRGKIGPKHRLKLPTVKEVSPKK
jgi:hypothetical protein